MSVQFQTIFLLASLLINLVSSHGFLFNPNGLNVGAIRGISQISTAIDNLRNPIAQLKQSAPCRNQVEKSDITPLVLKNGASHTISFAISINAQHIGPCNVEILDSRNLNLPGVFIADEAECARLPIAEKIYPSGTASAVCPNAIPKGLVTNDMCLLKWTFTVINADKIKCGEHCVMRWSFNAVHLLPDVEEFMNCADVSVNVVSTAGTLGNTVSKTKTNTIESDNVTESEPTDAKFKSDAVENTVENTENATESEPIADKLKSDALENTDTITESMLTATKSKSDALENTETIIESVTKSNNYPSKTMSIYVTLSSARETTQSDKIIEPMNSYVDC